MNGCEYKHGEQYFAQKNAPTCYYNLHVGCKKFKPPEPEPTHADRIRAMSDEELAEAIMCPMEFAETEILCRRETGQGSCDDCCLAWLRSEATT